MKKITLATALLAILIVTVVFAQEKGSGQKPMRGMGNQRQAGMMMGGGMMGGGMMGQGDMKGGMGRKDGMGREAGKAAMYLRHAQDLKLTDDQVKKLKDGRAAFLKDMIDKRAKLAAGRIDLGQLLDSDNPDMAAVEKKVRANHEISADIAVAAIRANKAADAALTADQLKAARELSPRFQRGGQMGRMGQGMGRGMMMNHPGVPEGMNRK